MLNFINKVRYILPKRYKGKRVKAKENRFKSFLFRHVKLINRVLYVILALILAGMSYFSFFPKNNKKAHNKVDMNIASILSDNKETLISKQQSIPNILDEVVNVEEIFDFENTFTPLEETDNLNFNIEIDLLLEKNNMSYEDLIKLIFTPRYKNAFQSLLDKYPNLTTDNLINLLRGESVSLRDTLYLGDSRTQGMLNAGAINEENAVYGVGYGYNWLIGKGEFNSSKTNALNGAISGIESKMEDNKSYNIVIWLGVNDYGYISSDTYFEEFKSLATGPWQNHQIYIVSVGPVDDSKAAYVNNAGIHNFNVSLEEKIANSGIANLNYVDLNLNSRSINSYDKAGLHYGASDYQNIHSIITSEVKKSDEVMQNDVLNLCYNILLDYDRTASTQNEIGNNMLYR